MSRIAVALHRAAHGRSGDKGNWSNISVIAWHPDLWQTLVDQVTEDAVFQRFVHRRPTAVRRYLLPQLHAMNFVIEDALDGGVNASLNLDTHGKVLSSWLLDMRIEVTEGQLVFLVG